MKRAKTSTFLLELPLQVDWSTEKILRAHLEAARCLYNALLGEANKRLQQMRRDPAWQKARALPRSDTLARTQAFSQVRKNYLFSEYDLHEYAKEARCTWIANHIESTMAQTLATRAYQAVNRVCVGKARRSRDRSAGTTAPVVAGRCSAICTRASSWRTSHPARNAPRSPGLTGKVRSRACEL
jgi:putative transposase